MRISRTRACSLSRSPTLPLSLPHAEALCPGPYGGPRRWAFSYERSTPVCVHVDCVINEQVAISWLRRLTQSGHPELRNGATFLTILITTKRSTSHVPSSREGVRLIHAGWRFGYLPGGSGPRAGPSVARPCLQTEKHDQKCGMEWRRENCIRQKANPRTMFALVPERFGKCAVLFQPWAPSEFGEILCCGSKLHRSDLGTIP